MRTAHGHHKAEAIADVLQWLRDLDECPPVTRAVVARCTRPVHGVDPATWFYVEADAAAGVARLRCLACGDARAVMDSEERWTYPPAWSCQDCRQSIAEVAFGVHTEDDVANWLAVAVRCVECGNVAGVTDMVVPNLPADEFVTSL